MKAAKYLIAVLGFITLLLNAQNLNAQQCQADWQWAKGFQGPTGDDWPLAVVTDKWNNVIVACTSETTYITIDTAYVRSAAIVVTKFSPSGKLLWIKKFAGGEPHGLVTDQNGNIYMAGLFWNALVCDEFTIFKYPLSSWDGFLVKISSDGKALWGRKASNNTLPGSMVYMGQGLAIDTIRSKLILSGSFSGKKLLADNVTLSHSTASESTDEGFILVYDTTGNAEWGKVMFTYGTLLAPLFVYGITTDRIGNIYVSGYYSSGIKIDTFTSSNDPGSMFCVKFNSQGIVQWLSASKKGYVRPRWMHTDLDANIYMGGVMYHWPVVIDKLNFSPICGQAGMVIKIDSNGNFKWVRAITGMQYSSESVDGIAVDDVGNSYGIGKFSRDSLFIDSLKLKKLSSRSAAEPYMFKFNTEGHLDWIFRPHTSNKTDSMVFNIENDMRIAVDKQGNVFPAFGWRGWPYAPKAQKIIMGKDSIPISGTSGYADVVMGKIRNNFTAVIKAEQVTCHGSNNGQARLYISGGEPPVTINWSNSSHQEELKNLSPGFYKVTVTDNNGCISKDSIEIKEPSQLYISVTIKPDSAGLHKGEATATVSGGTPPYTYLWNDPANQKTAKATGLAKGTYKVTVTDINGCSADTTITLHDVTGIDELFTKTILVYPNPVFDGLLNIQMQKLPQDIIIGLYDDLGREIISRKIPTGSSYHDQLSLPYKGIYILKVEMGGKVYSKNVVVQ